jgi:hypothetical protein
MKKMKKKVVQNKGNIGNDNKVLRKIYSLDLYGLFGCFPIFGGFIGFTGVCN